jgi:hypothetical protein
MDKGASLRDRATRALHRAGSRLGLTASIPSAVEQIILDRIDSAQRAFILRMKPHRNDQRINAADWDAIDPCVEVPNDWPDTYWFGGMRLTWVNNRATRTFRFNEAGLNVRGFLATAASSAPAEGQHAPPVEAGQRREVG